jgi:hypothetical protein
MQNRADAALAQHFHPTPLEKFSSIIQAPDIWSCWQRRAWPAYASHTLRSIKTVTTPRVCTGGTRDGIGGGGDCDLQLYRQQLPNDTTHRSPWRQDHHY